MTYTYEPEIKEAKTTISNVVEFEINSPKGGSVGSCFILELEEELPESFFQGLKDCDEGRTVDLDTALEDPPAPEIL